MFGLGTILNVALIIAGGICGMLFGKRIKEGIRETLTTVCAVSVIIIGIGGAVEKMLVYENGKFSTTGGVKLILCLALGGIIGELIGIHSGVIHFGEWLKKKSGSSGDNSFVSAFVSASCTVCIGAMAVVGSIEDGISGDYTILLTKGILDAIIICIMSASVGKGAVFSAIPVLLLQGSVTVAARFAGGFMTEPALDNLSFVGSVMIFCVGLNLMRKEQIRVANLLPAVVIAAAWGFISP
ncbi:MAG: DUF554 domain-containing protein [Oscillospiraceae bacterium]